MRLDLAVDGLLDRLVRDRRSRPLHVNAHRAWVFIMNQTLKIFRQPIMNFNEDYPLALDSPKEKVNVITEEIIKRSITASRKSPRKRIIFPFHKSPSDNLHRMLNVLQPLSYIQPHRHVDPPKAESIIILMGRLVCVEFDHTGKIKTFYNLSPDSMNIGIDIEPGIFHTIFAVENDTVLFEVKPGPYEPSSDKDYANWAPAEDSGNCGEYLKKLYRNTESS